MFVMTALLLPGLARADGSKLACLGLTLPAGSKRLGNDPKECRFASSMNWEETVKFFDRGLPSAQTRWHREVNIPAAKYRHVESTNSKTPWEGFNIYQVGGDPSAEIRLYVIPRAEEAKPKKTSSGDASKKKDKKDKEHKKGK